MAVSGLSSGTARIKRSFSLTGKCSVMPNFSYTHPLGAIAENSQSIGSEYKKDENYYSKVETINWYLTDDKEKYQKDKNKKEAGKFIDKKAYWNHEN